MKQISETDLILNADGSIYHLNLLPEDIADTIITVGDQDRVSEVSAHFDSIEVRKGKREFITHTGYIGSNRISVVSTGIGTDNIDIVINELDALGNIDFESRTENKTKKSLQIIRIGTSGSLQESIPVDSILISQYAIGMDTLMHFYGQSLSLEEEHFKRAVLSHFEGLSNLAPYVSFADRSLFTQLGSDLKSGITVTAPGFYAPQGRSIRSRNIYDNLLKTFQNFRYNGKAITNLEMETAGIYALADALGHKALSVNAVLANRVSNVFSSEPQRIIRRAISQTLEKLF